jgi:hypothetical protein
VAALASRHIAALATDRLAALTTATIMALTTSSLKGLTTSAIRALTTAQVARISTTQLPSLSSSQMFAMSTTQTEALSSTQLAALSTTQLSKLHFNTPLVLDLGDLGIQTRSLADGVLFDITASGTPVHTGWTGANNGLLALDRNGDGIINDGSELFGSSTPLAGGGTAADGFAALAALDANHDGVIDRGDTLFNALRVWVDSNNDGFSQQEELSSLDKLGIAKLNLAATAGNDKNQGNWVGLVSSFEKVDGSIHAMADVWFQAEAQAAPRPATSIGNMVDAMRAFDATTQLAGAPMATVATGDALKLKALEPAAQLLLVPSK